MDHRSDNGAMFGAHQMQNVYPTQRDVQSSQQNFPPSHQSSSGQNVYPSTSGEHDFYSNAYGQNFYPTASDQSVFPGGEDNSSPNHAEHFTMYHSQDTERQADNVHEPMSLGTLAALTSQQIARLEFAFSTETSFDSTLYQKLALQLNLEYGTVVAWFQHRKLPRHGEKEEQSRGKNPKQAGRRKPRTIFTESQLTVLHSLFARKRFYSHEEMKSIAASLGFDSKTIKVWFQNRRSKARKIEKQQGTNRPTERSQSDDNNNVDAKISKPGSVGSSSLSDDSAIQNPGSYSAASPSTSETPPDAVSLQPSESNADLSDNASDKDASGVTAKTNGGKSRMMLPPQQPSGMQNAGMMSYPGMYPGTHGSTHYPEMSQAEMAQLMMQRTNWQQLASHANLHPASYNSADSRTGLQHTDAYSHPGSWPMTHMPGEYRQHRRMQLEHIQASVSSPLLKNK